MRFVSGISCPNPSCQTRYDALIESGYHAECPGCHQINRVAGKAMSEEITGHCGACGRAIDDHIHGRLSYACPPSKGRSF